MACLHQRKPIAETCSTSTYVGKKQSSKFKGSLTLKSNITCLYYYDDRKEKLLKILAHLLFLLEIVGAYFESLLFIQIVTFILTVYCLMCHSCVMNIFAHLIQLRRVWMKMLSSWLFAQVSLQTILAEIDITIY